MSLFLDRMTPKKQTYRSLIITYYANANRCDRLAIEWLGEFLNECAEFEFDPSNYPYSSVY